MGLGRNLKQLIEDTPTLIAVEDAIDDLPAIIEEGTDLLALAADATPLGTLADAQEALSALAADATPLAALADIETELSGLAADDVGILAASSAIAGGIATTTVTFVSDVQYVTDPAAGIQKKTITLTFANGVLTTVGTESEWT